MRKLLKPRNAVILAVAALIDAAGLLVGLALWAIFLSPATLGAVAGCALGAAGTPQSQSAEEAPGVDFAAGAGGYVSGTVSNDARVNCIGGAAGGAVIGWFASFIPGATVATRAIGWALGYAIDFCFATTFGFMLLLMLASNGLLTWRTLFSWRRMPFILGKLSPFTILPLYTAMTVACIWEKEAQKTNTVAADQVGDTDAPEDTFDGVRPPANVSAQSYASAA